MKNSEDLALQLRPGRFHRLAYRASSVVHHPAVGFCLSIGFFLLALTGGINLWTVILVIVPALYWVWTACRWHLASLAYDEERRARLHATHATRQRDEEVPVPIRG